jgi:hypothetical protein
MPELSAVPIRGFQILRSPEQTKGVLGLIADGGPFLFEASPEMFRELGSALLELAASLRGTGDLD